MIEVEHPHRLGESVARVHAGHVAGAAAEERAGGVAPVVRRMAASGHGYVAMGLRACPLVVMVKEAHKPAQQAEREDRHGSRWRWTQVTTSSTIRLAREYTA